MAEKTPIFGHSPKVIDTRRGIATRAIPLLDAESGKSTASATSSAFRLSRYDK
jgi:hypothetical protein